MREMGVYKYIIDTAHVFMNLSKKYKKRIKP